ncbi:Hypothetical predicted protein [Olea europaea subsp. europaea]|uniref:Uncharacterized protein n=1 Tax=Olea europaea subsp. europaea TaxID=158383 RepID=A0A8S0TZR5_OLEEU|nr:Hypothetical predicted protein [Olea europaea subsp. europaea]
METKIKLRPFGRFPSETNSLDRWGKDATGFYLVGVEGLDVDLGIEEFEFADICGLEVGVNGCMLLGSSMEDVLGEGRGLEGV